MRARSPFTIRIVAVIACLFGGMLAVPGEAQTFAVYANPAALTVYPGESNVPVAVSVTSSSYTGPVTLTLTGLPSGITIAPASLTLMPGASGTLYLNVGIHADQEAFSNQSASAPNTSTSTVMVVGAAGATVASSALQLTVSLTNPGFSPANNQLSLPVMRIDTAGTPVVNKGDKIPGTVTITSADGSKTYVPGGSFTDNTATFDVHGNTTAVMPKKPYNMKLNTSVDLLTLLGVSCPYSTSSGKAVCDKSKSYVLLANYDDKTMLRDWSASALANAIPYGGSFLNETPVLAGYSGTIPTPSGTSVLLPWAPHSLFVELYLNGVYEGVYQLIEKVNVDSHRVDISELAATDTTGDLSGGYLLEIDQRKDEAFVFTTPKGLPIGLIDPDFSPYPEVPAQTSYISNYVDAAENALFSSNYTDPTTGWRAYFDEAAAINFYLVNDIMGNVDGGDFYSSVYFYKAADNPFLYMGPVWDFDISSGNVNYQPIVNPTVPWMQTKAVWYQQLFTDPGFKADVVNQFNQLKSSGILASWLSAVTAEAGTLESAQANNYQRWPMLGIKVWPNPEAGDTYDQEVSYFTNYINLRISYLDSTLNGKTSSATTLAVSATSVPSGSPEQLTAHVTAATAPTGTVSFLSAGILVGTATLDNTGTATFATTTLQSGTYRFQAVYNGDSVNALSASGSMNVTVAAPLVQTVTSLSASPSSVAAGSTVMLNASVLGTGGSTMPTGNVVFSSGQTTLGTAALANGVASLSTTNLPVGDNAVVAMYAGTTAFASSTSNSAPVSVSSGTATVAITVGANVSGLSFTVDGNSYTSSSTLNLVPGTVHTLATTTPQTLGSVQYAFTSWSDGGALSHSFTVPASAAQYTATFTANQTTSPATINLQNGFTSGSMSLNGRATLNGTRLRLSTSGATYVAASAFYPTAVNVQNFTTDFSFQLTAAVADGFMFVIQGQGPKALGGPGANLGFGTGASGIQKSVGIKFDLYSNAGEGSNSTGLYLNGASPTTPATDLTPSGVNLHSGDVMRAHLTYDGTTLMVTLTDTTTGATATQSYTVSIPATVGGSTAYVGFTAGTGQQSATQDVLNWTM